MEKELGFRSSLDDEPCACLILMECALALRIFLSEYYYMRKCSLCAPKSTLYLHVKLSWIMCYCLDLMWYMAHTVNMRRIGLVIKFMSE